MTKYRIESSRRGSKPNYASTLYEAKKIAIHIANHQFIAQIIRIDDNSVEHNIGIMFMHKGGIWWQSRKNNYKNKFVCSASGPHNKGINY